MNEHNNSSGNSREMFNGNRGILPGLPVELDSPTTMSAAFPLDKPLPNLSIDSPNYKAEILGEQANDATLGFMQHPDGKGLRILLGELNTTESVAVSKSHTSQDFSAADPYATQGENHPAPLSAALIKDIQAGYTVELPAIPRQNHRS